MATHYYVCIILSWSQRGLQGARGETFPGAPQSRTQSMIFALYFSGSCIPTRQSLLLMALPYHSRLYPFAGWVLIMPITQPANGHAILYEEN